MPEEISNEILKNRLIEQSRAHIAEMGKLIAEKDAAGSDHMVITGGYSIQSNRAHTGTSANPFGSNSTTNTWTMGNTATGNHLGKTRIWCRCSEMVLLTRADLNELKQLKSDVLCPTCLHKEAAILKEKLA